MSLDEIIALPAGILVVLGILLVIELALLIVGVIAWAGTPEDRMPPPSKWLWLALVLFLQILGPIAFLVVRRQHARHTPDASQIGGAPAVPGQRRSASDTADLLYGRPGDARPGDRHPEDGHR